MYINIYINIYVFIYVYVGTCAQTFTKLNVYLKLKFLSILFVRIDFVNYVLARRVSSSLVLVAL